MSHSEVSSNSVSQIESQVEMSHVESHVEEVSESHEQVALEVNMTEETQVINETEVNHEVVSESVVESHHTSVATEEVAAVVVSQTSESVSQSSEQMSYTSAEIAEVTRLMDEAVAAEKPDSLNLRKSIPCKTSIAPHNVA